MPKKLFKKITPHPDYIKNHKSLSLINKYLHSPDLWHLNRRSVPKALAIGIFCAFLPIPCQMLLAAILALYFRSNLSLAVILVWITNPITMGPIFYFAYKIGCFILNASEFNFNSNNSITNIFNNIVLIWQPLWLGSMILAITSSVISYFLVKLIWYWALLKRINNIKVKI